MKIRSFFSERTFYTHGVVIILLFFISTKQSLAQIEKGTFTVGNSFFVLLNDRDNSVNQYVQLNTGMSYFVAKNLAVGLNYNWSKVKADLYGEYHNINSDGGGAYVRYYLFIKKELIGKNAVVGFFIQANTNISFSRHEFHLEGDDPNQFKQTAKQFYLHPGLVVMVGKKWSFECSFQGYTYETYKTNVSYVKESSDYSGIGMNSVLNNQNYAVPNRS